MKPQPSGALRVPAVTRHHESPFDRVETLATGVRLLVEEGPDAGGEFVLDGLVVSGGRGAGQDVRLSDSLVSEVHFELRLSEQGLALCDLGSRNGTWVGRARLLGAVELREGASFFVGGSRIRVTAIEQGKVSVSKDDSLCGMYGRSVEMRRLFALLRKLAPTKLEVLIEGETGVGKEGVARALHELSGRKGQFLPLNCGAVPRELAEGLLFGHKKGAFTGASESAGAFESADGGTLFLDEIGELPLDLQPKLLRVIDQQEVVRIGEHGARKVDVRVVCATHRNLGGMVAEGAFREDLFYRVATMRIEVPSLRERREDIPGLARLFLRAHAEEKGWAPKLSDDAAAELGRADWKGNVRQLKAVVRCVANLVEGDEITAAAVRRLGGGWTRSERHEEVRGMLPLRVATDDFQREYCQHLLRQAEGDVDKAAGIADYSKRGFVELLKRLGVDT